MGKTAVLVGVRDLKNRLTTYLRLARHDHEIIVTERGEPIAIIQALDSTSKPETLAAKIATLAARGLVTPPSARPAKRVRRIRVRGTPLSEVIVDDRR